MKIMYDWIRFWYMRDGKQSVGESFVFDNISDKKCLILLGTAGVGKTTVVDQLVKNLKENLPDTADILKVDLRSVSSETRMKHLIFTDSVFINWVNGSHELHLFLDSLDEGLLQTGHLGDLLIEGLRGVDTSRLKLRIACRTGSFPGVLEDKLKKIWEKEDYEIVILKPLDKDDVLTACAVWNLPGEEVWNWICLNHLQSLSSLPVTLNMLLDVYSNNQDSTGLSKIRLYKEGCRHLCSEVNPERCENRSLSGIVPTDRRMRIAMLLGAVTMLCNKSLLVRGRAESGEVSIDKIVSVFFDKFEYTFNDIREVLGTALFTEKGRGKYFWSHLSYAEFFAAQFLGFYSFSYEQIISLLFQAEDHYQRVIPQLMDTAAWAAAGNGKLFCYIAEKDPAVLLTADFSLVDDRKKALLVISLLNRYDFCEGYLMNAERDIYKNLYHKNLTLQLSDFIKDDRRSPHAKHLAVCIALECGLTSLAKDILHLSSESDEWLASEALYAFFHLCSREELHTARALLEEVSSRLACYIFENLYPDYAGIEDVMICLRRLGHTGYDSFDTVKGLLYNLRPEDLAGVLAGACSDSGNRNGITLNAPMMDAVMIYSWSFMHIAGVRIQWIGLLVRRLKEQGIPDALNLFDNDIEKNAEFIIRIKHAMRWMLTKDCLEYKNYHNLISHQTAFIPFNKTNLHDMFSIIEQERNRDYKKWMSDIIIRIFEPDATAEAQAVSKEITALKEKGSPWYEKEGADSIKRQYDNCVNNPTRQKSWFEPDRQRLSELLADVRKNVIKFWPELVEELSKDISLAFSEESKVLDGQVWHLLNEGEKRICFDSALEFLEKFDAESYPVDNWNYSILPVIEAAELVWNMKEADIDDWDTGMWEKMSVYIMAPESKGYAFDRYCLKKLYTFRPEWVSEKLIAVLLGRRNAGTWMGIRSTAEYRIEICADELMSDRIKTALEDESIALSSRYDLYKVLLRTDEKQVAYLGAVVSNRYKGYFSYKCAIAAGGALLEIAPGKAEEIMLPVLKSAEDRDIRFMILLWSRYMDEYGVKAGFLEKWSSKELAMVYLFIHKNRAAIDRRRRFNPRCGSWKASLLTELERRGDIKSIETIFWLSGMIKDCRRLQSSWEKLRGGYFRTVWTPPDMDAVLEMLGNTSVTPVTNGEQLLNAVRNALLHFEEAMNTEENPLAYLLWNQYMGIYIPKSEEDLSNFLGWYVDKELGGRKVILNREVQIYHNKGGKSGEIIDIKVEVPNCEGADKRIKMYVEVKGCWNPELDKAMEQQLLKRYMIGHRCNFGLYVVGWFNCYQWSRTEDTRKIPVGSYEDAKKRLEEQASFLSQKYNVFIKAVVLDLSLK